MKEYEAVSIHHPGRSAPAKTGSAGSKVPASRRLQRLTAPCASLRAARRERGRSRGWIRVRFWVLTFQSWCIMRSAF